MRLDSKDYAILIVIAILTALVCALIFAAIITPIWNYTLPYLFGIKKITYWRSFCLYLLIDCLVSPLTISINKNND